MWLGRHSLGLSVIDRYIKRFGINAGVVCKESDIVLEGYPRCGNTMAYVSFVLAQRRPVCVAHHVHGPAQVREGIRMGVPVVVLVRNPVDAVSSLLVRDDRICAGEALKNYIRFYGPLIRCRNQFVIAPFGQVVSDFGAIIDRVNAKYATEFEKLADTDENLNRCREEILELDCADRKGVRASGNSVAFPDIRRREAIERVRKRLEDGERGGLVAEAKKVFREFVKDSGAVDAEEGRI